MLDAGALPAAESWAGLKTVGLCEQERSVKGKTTKERAFFATSLGLDAKKFAAAVRGHWLVEKGLHWTLDVAFNEDKLRYRNRVMAQNLNCLRKIVLNILKRDSRKKSLRAKRLMAAVNVAYREALLSNFL